MKICGRRSSWTAVLCAVAAVHTSLGSLPGADAHGFLTAPKVEFRSNDEDPTAYSGTIDGPMALPVPAGMHYDWGPSLATNAFATAFGNSSYKSLREFVMKHQTMQPSKAISPECGRTNGDASPQPLPEIVAWSHGDNEGFTPSHEGPCEVWCDDERVFVEKNCAKTYQQVPAKLPYERAKCVGKRRLQIVWLALHEGTRWQVYMNCARLKGGAATLSSADAPLPLDATPTSTVAESPSPPQAALSAKTRVTAYSFASTPAPLTIAPTLKTAKPSASTDEYPSTSTPSPPVTRPPMSTYGNTATEAPQGHEHATVSASTPESDYTEVPWKQSVRTPYLSMSKTSHPRPLRPVLPPPTRRVEEQDDVHSGADDVNADIDRYESGNPWAPMATGPIPEDIYEEARKAVGAENKKREERRKALKKEFGYA